MTRARAGLGAICLLAACVARPVDPFLAAEHSLRGNDLADALRALDMVPVAHARYPEARAAAIDVERNMRHCHELMLEAMLLRSEWRDAEALAALRKVRGIWPRMPGVDVLITATEHRRVLFEEQPRANVLAGPSAGAASGGTGGAFAPAPAGETGVGPWAAGPRAQPSVLPLVPPALPASDDAVASVLAPAPAAANVPPPTAAPFLATADVPQVVGEAVAPPAAAAPRPAERRFLGEDPVAACLVAVEARLGRGQLEEAVVDLLALAGHHPDDVRVRSRLARLLHQRALLRYGDGALDLAIGDWQRVLELEPGNLVARRMLEAVAAERR